MASTPGSGLEAIPDGQDAPAHAPSAADLPGLVRSDPQPATLATDYHPRPPGYDELHDGEGREREHWRPLIDGLTRLGDSELRRRWDNAERMIHANGVTYNVYGDGGGHDRPWQLEAVPLILPGEEWAVLERGLQQRARLLDRIIADVYGEQRLVRDGLLPATVIRTHPGFLRPCVGMQVPGGRWLHFYAADLVRASDGRWRVIADRTQAPSGAGYALENRIVISRTFSESYQEARVQRLARYFLAVRQTLTALGATLRDPTTQPRIVLLSPGPAHETYFEHAYLARYLGFTLVEGGDLTVRDDQVFLKTLGGLHRVHVILRRLDDDYCDPLELKNESTLGVPGLLAVARAGQVAIGNALGSAVADNAALLPRLPDLCRHLLGEELLLPSTPTAWGGDGDGRLLADPESVLRAAFPGTCLDAILRRGDDACLRRDLDQHLQLHPEFIAAQERIPPSLMPVLRDGRLRPRALTLRAFAVAQPPSAGDGSLATASYMVMPGGLARVFNDHDPILSTSFQRGGGSVDIWVQSQVSEPPVTLLPPSGAPLPFKRGSADLPSRVADHLFWLGRYGERAEASTRLLRVLLQRLGVDRAAEHDPGVQALLAVMRSQGMLAGDEALGAPAATDAGSARSDRAGPAVSAPAPALGLEQRLIAVAMDPQSPHSLHATVRRLHHAAFTSRDRLSHDTWRILTHLEQELANCSSQSLPRRSIDVLPLLDRTVIGLAAFAGMVMEGTTRGPGWRFLDLGRRLERALAMTDLLRCTLVPAEAANVLEMLLDVADSGITYRSRYMTAMQVPLVLDLLLNDVTNPRSVGFQTDIITDHVAHLPQGAERALPSPAERLALGIQTWVRLVDPLALCATDERGERSSLAHVLDHLSSDLALLCDSITTQYLNHASATRNLSPPAALRPRSLGA